MSAKAQIKSAVYWTAPTMLAAMTDKFHNESLLIVDYENFTNNREVLAEIKKGNPAIKIIAYFNPMEVWKTEKTGRTMANKLLKEMPPAFFLKRADKKPVQFWPEMIMMNMSSYCPIVKGKNYNQYYANWLIEILDDELIDGCFEDNGTPTISWIDPLIDADNNGKTDQATELDSAWKKGMTEFIKLIRAAKGKDFIIITNKGVRDFFSLSDGVMFEKFPNNYLGDKKAGGWYQCLENSQEGGEYVIFQVDQQNLAFGLASSLLFDNLYIALGENMIIQKNFRPDSGEALGPMYIKDGIYYRQYKKLTVQVNPVKKTGRLIMKGAKIP
jgi:hypothetical protein